MGKAAMGKSRIPPRGAERSVLGDPRRMAALRALPVGRDDRSAFDAHARLVARATGATTAIVSVVGADRQVVIGQTGLGARLLPTREIPIATSLCRHVVTAGDIVRVDDLGDDDSGLALGIRAYLGAPLRDRDGHCVGAVCAADPAPRHWSDDDVATLVDAAEAVSADLARRAVAAAGADAADAAALVAAAHDGVVSLDAEGRIVRANDRLCAMTGLTPDALVGSGPDLPFWTGDDAERGARALADARTLGAGSADVTIVRADGHAMRAALTARGVPGPRGTGCVAVLRDISERERLESRLRSGEALHRSLFTAMAEGVVVHAGDGSIVTANPAAEEILGLTADQIRGRTSVDPLWRCVRPDGTPLPGEEHPAMEALRTGRAVTGAVMGIHTPDGALRWIQVSAEPIPACEGGRAAVVATFTDVTALRAAEDGLRVSEARFRHVADDSPACIVVTDADGSCTWVNARWCEIAGLPPESALGTGWVAAVHPSDRPRVFATWQEGTATGGAFCHEFRMRGPEGVVSSVTATVAPLHDDRDAVVGHVAVVTDTARDHFFEVSPDLMCVLRADGGFVRVNTAFQEVLGLPKGDLLGMALTDLVHPDDLPDARAALRMIGDRRPLTRLQTRCRTRDGEFRWFSWSAGRDPATHFVYATARDITVRKQTEATESAVQRVAEVVAQGRSSRALFQAVAAEVVGLMGVEAAAVFRFDGERAVAMGASGRAIPVGHRVQLHGAGALARVAASGNPAATTVDEIPPDDPLREVYRRGGLSASIATPVTVRGRLWGAILVSASDPAAVARTAAARLTRFANLMATAIAAAEGRREIAENAAEQAALRRVATLVASEAQPRAVFDLVAEEAAALLGAEACGVLRLEPGRAEARVVAWWTEAGLKPLRPGSEVTLPGGTLRGVHVEALPDAAELARWLLPELPDDALRGCAAAPVAVEGEIWGAVVVADRDPAEIVAARAGRLTRFAELVGLAISSADARAQLATMASTDHLTGVWNRRAFDERIEVEVGRALRHNRPLSLVVIDLDHFKRINDRYGHQVGDQVLAEVASRLRQVARNGEIVARVGGEEFAWILPETDAGGALAAAERARAAISQRVFPVVGRVTSSAGVCDLAEAGSAGELFRLADLGLYWAKAQGRDASFRYSRSSLELLPADEQERRLDRARALAAIQVLAQAVDARDSSTQRHSERVASLAERMALAAGWTPDRASTLHEAGRVHDVGKVGIPDAVLGKPGRLDEEEYALVRQHAEVGALMVTGTLSDEQAEWVRHHHERYDGTGYPRGLAGDQIPDGARILALADAWDAMTTPRVYCDPRPAAEALEECRRESGHQFCPDAVAALLMLWDDEAGRLSIPPGSEDARHDGDEQEDEQAETAA